jgi:hypothetical protein
MVELETSTSNDKTFKIMTPVNNNPRKRVDW